ncbi:hypothetical protein ACFL1G_07450 [Planctomycetota bacterium]
MILQWAIKPIASIEPAKNRSKSQDILSDFYLAVNVFVQKERGSRSAFRKESDTGSFEMAASKKSGSSCFSFLLRIGR